MVFGNVLPVDDVSFPRRTWSCADGLVSPGTAAEVAFRHRNPDTWHTLQLYLAGSKPRAGGG